MAQAKSLPKMVRIIATRAFRHPIYDLHGNERVLTEMRVVNVDDVETVDAETARELLANLKATLVDDGEKGDAQVAAAAKRQKARAKAAEIAAEAAAAVTAVPDQFAKFREEMLTLLPLAIAEGLKQAGVVKPA